MTHGRLRDIPRPLPLYATDGRINPLLTLVDIATLNKEERAALAASIGVPSLCSDELLAQRLQEMRQREALQKKEATLIVDGLRRGFHSFATLTLRMAYHFDCHDVMVACTGVEEAKEAVDAAEPFEPGGGEGESFDAERITEALSHLDVPGYYGPGSPNTGKNLLRLYVGREGRFTLHVLFEPSTDGPVVLSGRPGPDGVMQQVPAAFVLAGDPDSYGVRTQFARFHANDAREAAWAFARASRAEMREGEVGEAGLAFWFTWPT